MNRRLDPLEDLLRERLDDLRAPGESEATERAVSLAAEAAAEPRGTQRVGSSRALKSLVAAAGAALVAVVALTPAGADVRDWIDRAVSEVPPPVAPQPATLDPLPTDGRLLVEADEQVWVVEADGSHASLGDWDEGTFSPGGINVALAGGGQLAAATSGGEPIWRIGSRADRPRIEDPRWAPSGLRIVYRRGGELRVAIADGSGSDTLARGISAVAPAWRPRAVGTDPDVVAFAKPGRVILMDGDTGARRGQIRGVRAIDLEWLDGDRLLAVEPERVTVYRVAVDGGGAQPAVEVPMPGGVSGSVQSATASPDGTRVAVVLGPPSGQIGQGAIARLVLARIEPGKIRAETLFSGPGSFERPVFSPDGGWIQLGWPDSAQWVFISPDQNQKLLEQVEVVGDPGEVFEGEGRGGTGGVGDPRPGGELPSVSDWCCQ